jgi:opacity protein-like surface antigen
MKKPFLGLLILLAFSLAALAQNEFLPRFELHGMGGYGLSQFKGDSIYSYEWSYELLQSVKEDTLVSMKAKGGLVLTGGASFFFHPNFGIQIGGGYFSSNVPNTGSFTFAWQSTEDPSVITEEATWDGDGKMTTIPLFLNFVGKFRLDRVNVFLTAGPTLYLNSFESNSFVGFGDSYSTIIEPYLYQWVDAFQIPVSIPKTSWKSFGANFGLGIDFEVSPGVAITAEGRYFLIPKESLVWQWIPGTYDSIFYDNFTGWEYTEDDLADFQKEMTTLEVKPSFFSFALGIRLTFGQR